MSTSWTYGCGNVSDTFYIGNFWAGTFSGQIDDVRIFNYALRLIGKHYLTAGRRCSSGRARAVRKGKLREVKGDYCAGDGGSVSVNYHLTSEDLFCKLML